MTFSLHLSGFSPKSQPDMFHARVAIGCRGSAFRTQTRRLWKLMLHLTNSFDWSVRSGRKANRAEWKICTKEWHVLPNRFSSKEERSGPPTRLNEVGKWSFAHEQNDLKPLPLFVFYNTLGLSLIEKVQFQKVRNNLRCDCNLILHSILCSSAWLQ